MPVSAPGARCARDQRSSRVSGSPWCVRVLVTTWAPAATLPPMLAVASVLDRRGHEVAVLASGETRNAAEQRGFEVIGYRDAPIRTYVSRSRNRRT